jgi:AcrR family transcriptional regulator
MAMQKQEKMEYVAEHVLKIILARGLNGLSYAQVAKSSGVSRAWLYKYVGESKEQLIGFAVVHFGKIFSDLDAQPSCSTREEFIQHALDGLKRIFDLSLRYPWILPLYFRYAGTRTVIGDTIRQIENLYFSKVEKEIERYMSPKKTSPRVLAEVLGYLNMGVALRSQNAYPNDPAFRHEVRGILKGFLDSIG